MFEEENKALKKLDERLASLSSVKGKDVSAGSKDRSNLDLGIRIIADLVAGIVVGLGVGVFLDGLFGTKPVLMIVFLLLGGAASFLNVYRTVAAYEKRQELDNKKEEE